MVEVGGRPRVEVRPDDLYDRRVWDGVAGADGVDPERLVKWFDGPDAGPRAEAALAAAKTAAARERAGLPADFPTL